MKDGIKYWLEGLDDLSYEKVLDYITDLQQENERLKERVAYLERSNNRREDTIIDLRFEVAEQEDYKSRCEKAIEYVKEHYPTSTINDQDDKHNLLNILQNGDDKDD